LLSVVELWNSY